jgi:allantoate deiminase
VTRQGEPAPAAATTTSSGGERAGADLTTEILARCDVLAGLSGRPDGIERVYLSPEHTAANAVTAAWMREAGMRTWQDAAGNVCGRLEGARPGLPAVLLGSHLDTVPGAGRYDGILGVLTAIAAVERLGPTADRLPFALEVVGFADEEGTRYGTTLLGSRAVAGAWDPAWWDLRDPAGTRLREAAVTFGLDPGRIGEAARRPDELRAYLEVHIEQGPLLEEADRALAVVTSIAGARRMLATVTGETRHCATPWDRRRDALAAASEMVLAVERICRRAGSPATVGHLRVEPDAVNVIPGVAELSIDLRDASDAARDATLDLVVAELDAIAARRGVRVDLRPTHVASAVACDPALCDAVRAGIAATGDPDPLELYSVAGHDAMAVAGVVPVGMLFVRCAGGISHHADESVRADDVAAALDALTAAVRRLAADA